MKFLPVLSALLVLSAVSSYGQGAAAATDIVLGKIAPQFVKTPDYSISGGPQKRWRAQDWLEVEIDYATKAAYIDELTFKFTIQLGGKVLVSEDITYVNIAADREHYAVVYVAPRTLSVITQGRPVGPNIVENIKVDVTKKGQPVGTASLKTAAIPTANPISGVILKKPETPFAPLFWDRYEAMKTESR